MIARENRVRRVGRGTKTALLVATAAFIGMCATASAAGELDQSFTRPTSLFNVISSVCPYAGQTFTAGRTGWLAAVEVEVFAGEGVPLPLLSVEIRGVTASGVPSSEILGRTTLASSSSLLGQQIVFPQRIHITAGQRYAIVVHYDGELGDFGEGLWSGGVENQYRAGALVIRCGGGTWQTVSDGYDVHFQTYIEP
jgi:hypothetical protein